MAEVETFLKYVLERSEEIGIHQENRGDSETFLSEMVSGSPVVEPCRDM